MIEVYVRTALKTKHFLVAVQPPKNALIKLEKVNRHI